jgi:nucleoside-diphosphate-sugar epimerase
VILVTGGTGFIGRHLVPELVLRPESVRVLVRDEDRARGLPRAAERARGDLRDPDSMAAALTGVRAVVHLAAVMDGVPDHVFGMQTANVEGTRGLVQAAVAAGVEHFVHVSSAGVYGSRHTTEPFTESDQPQPTTAYEQTKLAAERVVRDETRVWTVLRPTGVFGPGRAQTELFLRTVASRRVWFFGGTDTLFNPVYVGDVVAAVVRSLESGDARGEIINVGGERVLSYRDLVKAWAATLGAEVYHVRVPRAVTRTGAGIAGAVYGTMGRSLPARLAQMAHPVVNRAVTIDKARRLGVTPTPLEAAMSATVEQMRAGRRA